MPAIKQDISSFERTSEEIDNLLVLVRHGDHAAVQELILAHWELVEIVASTYAAGYGVGYLWDDMVSEGLVAITTKVNEIAMGRALQDHDNITPFLRVCIYRCIGDWVIEQKFVGSSRTQRNQTAAGVEHVGLHNMPWPEGTWHETDPCMMTDLRDFLESIPATEEERSILQLREAGNSFEEISAILGMAQTTVYMLAVDIYQRFVAATERLGDQ